MVTITWGYKTWAVTQTIDHPGGLSACTQHHSQQTMMLWHLSGPALTFSAVWAPEALPLDQTTHGSFCSVLHQWRLAAKDCCWLINFPSLVHFWVHTDHYLLGIPKTVSHFGDVLTLFLISTHKVWAHVHFLKNISNPDKYHCDKETVVQNVSKVCTMIKTES